MALHFSNNCVLKMTGKSSNVIQVLGLQCLATRYLCWLMSLAIWYYFQILYIIYVLQLCCSHDL